MSADVTGVGWNRTVVGRVVVGMTVEKEFRPRLSPAPRCEAGPDRDRGRQKPRVDIDWLEYFREEGRGQ
ncbi:hypothetical protein [Nocardia ninae]|uniref:Uncharacterized protein n=1 Tax=Nocardia ninae NBRC 108245 TaxID=1210091 RepID=A0A511MTD5_9NOCA|nr:hypothetical protein [Nocardia ninae]GEM43834.1 hypothetical protein NN4_83530 [Nocardia ninae NBRC 108245]